MSCLFASMANDLLVIRCIVIVALTIVVCVSSGVVTVAPIVPLNIIGVIAPGAIAVSST